VGRGKRSGEEVSGKLADLKKLSEEEKALAAEAAALEQEVRARCLEIPNLPHDSIPVGPPKANRVERTWGTPRKFDFKPLDHMALTDKLGLVDFARAAKISGAHFLLFTGLGARLERGLINFMLDLHTQQHGYREIWPPYLVNRAAMTGTGQLPKMEADMYRLAEDDLFLIPTAEVPVTNIYAGEILEAGALPVRMAAFTGCFRREAGSYGRETRGMTRVHQFDKVEMVQLVEPERSYEVLEELVGHAERVLQLLEIPYRVVCLASQDISFSAAKCYDIEAWSPATDGWLEVSSCSNFEDFQARRAQIRFRDKQKKVRLVHTLNGSGVALARTVIALLENHQNADGTVQLPKALRPYLGGLDRLTPDTA